ncbi:MAG: hypothetical protein PHV30_06455 [Candidatus Margulisbacteria bacterium]|nr:hypothetical protein [Candidatus Margulisiibacteriota bacterium]
MRPKIISTSSPVLVKFSNILKYHDKHFFKLVTLLIFWQKSSIINKLKFGYRFLPLFNITDKFNRPPKTNAKLFASAIDNVGSTELSEEYIKNVCKKLNIEMIQLMVTRKDIVSVLMTLSRTKTEFGKRLLNEFIKKMHMTYRGDWLDEAFDIWEELDDSKYIRIGNEILNYYKTQFPRRNPPENPPPPPFIPFM